MKARKHFSFLIRFVCWICLLSLLTGSALTASAAGQIQFTANGVNLREEAKRGSKVLGRFDEGQVVAYTGTTVVGGKTWYQVSKGDKTGYVMGRYARVVDGSVLTVQTQDTAAAAVSVQDTAATTATQTASVSAASGSLAVTTMQKVIVRASGSAKASQIKRLNSAGQVCTLLGPTNQANGYTWYNVQVKGVNGWIRGDLLRVLSASEAASYAASSSSGASAGTASAASASSGSTALYTPELADWNTSDIQKIFYKGCVATVTDVKTGVSFQVKRWSGGSHADVEPLTASDTAAICRIYSVSDASQITEKKNYQRRSILVTVAGHSYAASMYGVPHNADEGDTIKDNNYSGQFCIHFTNSSTHGTKKVDSDHQKAIQTAYTDAVTTLSQMGYTFN